MEHSPKTDHPLGHKTPMNFLKIKIGWYFLTRNFYTQTTNKKKSSQHLETKQYTFFFSILGLELRAYTLSHSTGPFFVRGFFQDMVLQTICPGWL
jgi:hypothetical protein